MKTCCRAGWAVVILLLVFSAPARLSAQDSAPAASFSVVVIPDSQYLVASFTNRWNAQIAWITNNAAQFNIKAVMHMGDLVDNGSDRSGLKTNAQWNVAMIGLSNLQSAGIPLILAPGNHDGPGGSLPMNLTNMSDVGLTPQFFSNYVNYGQGWSMGFQNPTNLFGSYLFITNGTQPYLLTSLAWQPNQTLLTWASNVVQTYSNVPTIYFEHIFVGQRHDGRISSWSDPWSVERGTHWGPGYFTPTYLWTNWLSTTPNVFWVASGHEPNDANSAYYGLPAADGHAVTFTLTDFQSFAYSNPPGAAGSNYMQLVTITPAENKVKVFTFSPSFTNNPALFSNTTFCFPLSGTNLPRLSVWQQARQQSAAQGGLALYLDFEITNYLTDMGPFSAKMVRSNLVYAPTELGMSAYFSDNDNTSNGGYVGYPLSSGNGVNMELDQFSGLNQVTASCWFKTTNQDWDDGLHALLGKFNTGTDGDFQLCVNLRSILRFSVVNASKSRVDLDVNAPSFNDGNWHHFCGVYDGTNMYSYFDNVLLGTIPQTGPVQTTAHAVGIGNNDTQTGYGWRGYMDEVKIATTAWTPGLVAQEYQRVATNLPPPVVVPPPVPPPVLTLVLSNNPPSSLSLALSASPQFRNLMATVPAVPGTNSLPLVATTFSTNVVLIYPAWASNFVIESSASMAPGSWSQVSADVNFMSNYMVVGIPGTSSNMFFRLRH